MELNFFRVVGAVGEGAGAGVVLGLAVHGVELWEHGVVVAGFEVQPVEAVLAVELFAAIL